MSGMAMDFINQNVLLIAVVVVSGLALLWQMLGAKGGDALSAAQATQLINREDAGVLDVREPDEFAMGHLPAAVNIPVAKLAERLGELDRYRDKPLIVCCAAGMRAAKAGAELRKQGFARVYQLAGGVDAWVGAGYPVRKGSRDK
jgi:rhodanese-related sulfurtransferase